MANGVRNSIWAAFFLAGMAFMATLIFMLRPELFSNQPIRVVNSAPRIVAGNSSPGAETHVEALPVPAQMELEPIEPVSNPPQVKPPAHFDQPAQKELPASTAETIVRAAREPQLPIARPIIPGGTIVGRVRPGGSVFGHATLTGPVPPPKSVDVFCGGQDRRKLTSRVYLRAEDNSLADVLVVVSDGLKKNHWPVPVHEVSVVQKNCEFEPYVSAVQVGQLLKFENLDPIMHNVSIPNARRNLVRNFAQMPGSGPWRVPITEAGQFIRIECNVHPWMVAYVNVIEHPFFAVTGRDGQFEIPNLPPGDYTITATHRKIGTASQKVKVTERESPQLEFAFVAPTEVAENK